MQLVLNTVGLLLRVRAGSFWVTADQESRTISPKQLDSIAVTADCMISSAAVDLAVENGISIYFFDRIGDAVGCLRSPYFESLATLRRKQVYFDDSQEAIDWVIDLFRQKTEGQLKVLRHLKDRRPRLKLPLTEVMTQLETALPDLDGLRERAPPTAFH